MNRRMPVFVGFLLLIVLSVMAGSRGVVQMVGADAAGDTFTYLPIMVKHLSLIHISEPTRPY